MERVGRRHAAPDLVKELYFSWVGHQRIALVLIICVA